MRIKEVAGSLSKWRFLRPGELTGSYSPERLRKLGFRQASNGSWFILRTRWTELVRDGKLK